MRGFLELQSLAVLAGWKHSSLSRVALSMILLGVPVNLISGSGDKCWGKTWSKIDKSLQVMLIFDLKWTRLIFNVLLIALREEVIPDPDVLGLLTGRLQDDLAVWWSRWIVHTVVGVFIDPDAYHTARTRPECMRALRGVGKDGELLPTSPYRVELMIELVRDATTITRGGARFLHIERERCLKSYQVFGKCLIWDYGNLFIRPISKEVLLKVRFGQHSIGDLDRREAIPRGCDNVLLVCHGALKLPPVHLDESCITLEAVLGVFNRARRAP